MSGWFHSLRFCAAFTCASIRALILTLCSRTRDKRTDHNTSSSTLEQSLLAVEFIAKRGRRSKRRRSPKQFVVFKKVVNASKTSCRVFGALAANSNCLNTAIIPARGLLNKQKEKKSIYHAILYYLMYMRNSVLSQGSNQFRQFRHRLPFCGIQAEVHYTGFVVLQSSLSKAHRLMPFFFFWSYSFPFPFQNDPCAEGSASMYVWSHMQQEYGSTE